MSRDIVKKLGKREHKWAVALTPEQCKLLNDSEKSELSTMLSFSGNESSSDISKFVHLYTVHIKNYVAFVEKEKFSVPVTVKD